MVPGTYTPMFMNTGGSIQFIGEGGRYVRTGNGDLTPAVHANTVNGDYVIVVWQYDQDSTTIYPPIGWNEIAFDQVGSSFKYACAGLIYAGTPPTVTLASGGDQLIATCLTFRGVNATTQIDATPVETEVIVAVGANTFTSQETTTVPNCYHINIIGHDYNTSSSSLWSAWANTSLESMTELVEYSTTSGWDGGFAVAGGIKTEAGLVGNTTFTSAINKDIGYFSFALRPA
jgi:hypothetical protein